MSLPPVGGPSPTVSDALETTRVPGAAFSTRSTTEVASAVFGT